MVSGSCLHVPSRLKGMETSLFALLHCVLECLHVPSRLKGMETQLERLSMLSTSHFSFTRAFPFEGNGNSILAPCSPPFMGMFTRAFPFEGNGNIKIIAIVFCPSFKFTRAFPFEGNGNLSVPVRRVQSAPCLHVPSRLKGMETTRFSPPSTSKMPGLHVPSRLKGIETFFSSFAPTQLLGGLHVPSRLKGIETSSYFSANLSSLVYTCLPV